jgi:predicted Zn-dependent protease
VVRLGGEVYRFIFAAKNRTAEADRALRESIQTFRRLTAQEIRSIKPLRLKVVKVQAGDTVESLSTRIPLDHPVERFQVLNGLDPDEQVKAGDLVKIIVE